MNKRICFISLTNLYLLPYFRKYVDLVDCSYDVVFWDRHGVVDDITGAVEVHVFNYPLSEAASKPGKLSAYLKFRSFLVGVLTKNQYDGIIILHSQAGVMIGSLLKRKYRGKYLLDIRDYAFERFRPYFLLEKSLVANSGLNVISSKGFERFLPKGTYTVAHNDCPIDDNVIAAFRSRDRSSRERIVISNIGLIRFHGENKKLIMALRNDSRFELRFIGTGATALEGFCRENGARNVALMDQFHPEKGIGYFCDSDIVSNLYGSGTPSLDYALSNKLYYAAKLGMPILVCPDTYMERVSMEYGFGFALDLNDRNIADKLVSYYETIEWHEFYRGCDAFVEQVNRDNRVFAHRVRLFTDEL